MLKHADYLHLARGRRQLAIELNWELGSTDNSTAADCHGMAVFRLVVFVYRVNVRRLYRRLRSVFLNTRTSV